MSVSDPAVERILSRLQKPGPCGDGWRACCPAHDDRNPSLSIRIGDRGLILLKCHANKGCSIERILAALEMTPTDLRLDRSAIAKSQNSRTQAGSTLAPFRNSPRPPKRWEDIESAATAIGRRLKARPSTHWLYHDISGDVIAAVLRFDRDDGSKAYRPLRRVAVGLASVLTQWELGDPPGLWPLYNLPAVLVASRIYLVEGEKAADALCSVGLVATTSAHGADAPHKTDWQFLAGKEVVCWPDNDAPGEAYLANCLRLLATLDPRPTAFELRLVGKPEKYDAFNWVADHGDTADLLSVRVEIETMVESVKPLDLDSVSQSKPLPVGGANHEKPKSNSTALVQLVENCATELFHDPVGDTYATIPVGSHRETHRIRSKPFKHWLAHQSFLANQQVAAGQSLSDAVSVLEGLAQFEGAEYPTFVRVAKVQERIYLDLCDQEWQAVEIDSSGWRVISNPPVRFRRAKGMASLRMPARGGSLSNLRRILKIDQTQWPLVIAWLVAAICPTGPFPILFLHGEQGSGKSNAARMLRSLIDPNTAPLRSAPRDPRDLMISANNGWIICFDNLSSISTSLSDSFCRLSTGGGLSTRTLFENDEETIFDATRPILLTGIDDLAWRSDLLERALIVRLLSIPSDRRRTEADLVQEFERARSELLGAILDAVVTALRNLPSTKLPHPPRMADFATWITAAEPALGLEPGEFLAAYTGNQIATNSLAIEASPVAQSIIELANRGNWRGTPADLLATLETGAKEQAPRQRSWPQNPRGLSCILRRLTPNFRSIGIDIQFGQSGQSRFVDIRRAQ